MNKKLNFLLIKKNNIKMKRGRENKNQKIINSSCKKDISFQATILPLMIQTDIGSYSRSVSITIYSFLFQVISHQYSAKNRHTTK